MRSSQLQFLLVFIFIACAFVSHAQSFQTDSWQEILKKKKGTVTLYWYESLPFIFHKDNGMAGIEYEIMGDFKKFLYEKYGVDVKFVWKEAENFGNTFERIRDAKEPGIFGVSAFSLTPERLKDVKFGPSYMSDISVLITSKNIPIVQSREEFNKLFSKLTAITIHATTYEQDIRKLRQEGDLDFKIQYIPSSQNILKSIEARDSAFGFIDLPVYMMMFAENPSVNVKRQNLFPVKRQGYAIIYPNNSDWAEPINAYFTNPKFSSHLETIISHYIDLELYHFIESLAIESNDMVVLLTKEKEIQYNDLVGKSEQIMKETRARNFLILLVAITLISLVIFFIMYRKRNQQKLKIELQQKSIEIKNEQLEKRNLHLVALDEEKNNLIKILAHDLRTPINHVQGLAQVFLLSNTSLPEEEKMIIQNINDASVRLNKMISNILDIDSIENNRIKVFMDDVAIDQLVSQVVKSFEKQASKKDIILKFNAASGNPSIKGDTLFLIQIFENLVSNAIKFSEKGKSITISIAEDHAQVKISIKDQGPGLTEEDKAMLFKKFQRLSAKPTDGENSTGLGLSIVKKYVELMEGQVWCESEPGKGAEFIVQFRKSKISQLV